MSKFVILLLSLCILGFIVILTAIPYLNVVELQKRAIGGDPNSQRILGYGYETGKMRSNSLGLIQKDKAKAIYWYEASAHQGNGQACYYLAKMYERENRPVSDTLAIKWFITGAELRNRGAIKELIEIYTNGRLGQPVDSKKAGYWQTKL